MDLQYRNLTDDDFAAWVDFTECWYYPNHILTDWPHLRWFLGGPPLGSPNAYETLLALAEDGRIAGCYGVMPARLRIDDKVLSFCWWVSGMVRPECRNLGIGKTFVTKLMDRFDACGGVGFNLAVKRNYVRYGCEFFGDRSLRRFLLPLRPEAYDLVAAIGFDRAAAERLAPPVRAVPRRPEGIVQLRWFDPGVERCTRPEVFNARVFIERSAAYLNWRYFLNPRVQYECTAHVENGHWRGYLAARWERYLPTPIRATRLIDMAGDSGAVESLLADKVSLAQQRGDALVEFLFAGDIYAPLLRDLGFTELSGPAFEWWPLVTTPIERRENHEFIFLGSRRPELFAGVPYEALYITRGDSDRDRANVINAPSPKTQ
jgi:hypothetical protein